MNKERMLQLADYIENLPDHKFEMEYWVSQKMKKENGFGQKYWKTYYAPVSNSKSLVEPLDCGTACCIAGWAAVIKNDFKPIAVVQNNQTIKDRALEWLELTEQEGENLFLLSIDTVWVDYITKCNIEVDEYEDTFTYITNRIAALVIRDIANGVVNIDKKYDKDESRKFLEGIGYYSYD